MRLCPLCGSKLECRPGPRGTVWCCSPECGACFRDIDPAGSAGRTAEEEERRAGGSATGSTGGRPSRRNAES